MRSYMPGCMPLVISIALSTPIPSPQVWDYQTKACVQTLEGHSHNIAAVCFHPELPIIVSGSEDGTIKLWHSTTYRLENTLDYRMERVWSLGYVKGSNWWVSTQRVYPIVPHVLGGGLTVLL